MTDDMVRIKRYQEGYANAGKSGWIKDKQHDEIIVNITTRNDILTKVLLSKCLETLNMGIEFND